MKLEKKMTLTRETIKLLSATDIPLVQGGQIDHCQPVDPTVSIVLRNSAHAICM